MYLVSYKIPVTMHRFGCLVQAPMNWTTFLCRTFLQVPKNRKASEINVLREAGYTRVSVCKDQIQHK